MSPGKAALSLFDNFVSFALGFLEGTSEASAGATGHEQDTDSRQAATCAMFSLLAARQ